MIVANLKPQQRSQFCFCLVLRCPCPVYWHPVYRRLDGNYRSDNSAWPAGQCLPASAIRLTASTAPGSVQWSLWMTLSCALLSNGRATLVRWNLTRLRCFLLLVKPLGRGALYPAYYLMAFTPKSAALALPIQEAVLSRDCLLLSKWYRECLCYDLCALKGCPRKSRCLRDLQRCQRHSSVSTTTLWMVIYFSDTCGRRYR